MKNMLKKININNLVIIGIILFITILIVVLTNKSSSVSYKITLFGDRYITLNEDEEFVEPGYIAYANDEDVTKDVKVINEIVRTPGVYKVFYKLNNYVEYRVVEIKKSIDYNLDIKLELNTTDITNEDVIININVIGETFYALTMPNGNTLYNGNNISYKVEKNGIYTFKAINSRNEEFIKTIAVNNIDKISPNGTCSAILSIKNTAISVISDEENLTYSYYDDNKLLETTSNKNYTHKIKTTNKIYVILEDEAHNKNIINCDIKDNRYYEQIKPSTNEKIIYHGDSDTFKTYIVQRDTYYLTYFWVKDAYTQLNKFDSPEYGRKLYFPSQLLSKASSKYNLKGKIMVGFNASGFYLKDIYDIASVRAYPGYDKTSVGTLVITDGKVVRNEYSHAVKTWYSIGVNKDNKLLVFTDLKSEDIEAKKKWSESVIASGIRNTFTFAAPLLLNGKRTNITTGMPSGFNSKGMLQAICQINENNFLLFTTKKETRNKIIDVFMELGCQTAMNLDGGGSIALVYKDKNSDKIVAVVGNERQLTEVGYFTE